ncbi:hypothetical protein [Tahibacter harae]|uniref:Uncharacterized protein n=1 Tax=Tahibacter harae TaxID=2963937 RepID=A0ABT1QVS2_9GAMM|nr:hypothetical protein [Tahibacter harae]MCQ4166378.1 hypothetical protein [Tahibacter harae]
MSLSGHDHATPSLVDGDGVRVVRERRSLLSSTLKLLAAALVVAGVMILLYSLQKPQKVQTAQTMIGRPADGGTVPVNAASPGTHTAEPLGVPATQPRSTARAAPPHTPSTTPDPDSQPSGDPNDLASYLSPMDPAPTMAEVIQALHDSGDHSGIGAFNPPGTSPPLVGLAVPADFELPPGYVRHHQVTDEGEPLEPILMFSPDGVFVDAAGRAIAIPPDRVVPADMAPLGLAIREITIPPAATPQP